MVSSRYSNIYFLSAFFATAEMEEDVDGVHLIGVMVDGEVQMMQNTGARWHIDAIKSSSRRLAWPKGGRSELWRSRLIFGSFVGINSSLTSWPVCQRGGHATLDALRSSATSFPYGVVPGNEVAGHDWRQTHEHAGQGPDGISTLCSRVLCAKGEAFIVIFIFHKVLHVNCSTTALI
jgi:hypothetical protein